MKSLSFENCSELYVFALFMVIIMFMPYAKGEKELPIIDLPKYEDINNYDQYQFRKPAHSDYVKLDPELFYQCVFNPEYQKLPHPHQDKDFQTYQLKFNTYGEIFNFEYAQEKPPEIEINEDQQVRDIRFVYRSNGQYILTTDVEYDQSDILEAKKKMLNTYSPQWYQLSKTDYQNVIAEYLVYPKMYELDTVEFSEARLQFGIYLQHIITTGIPVLSKLPNANSLDYIDKNIFNRMKSLLLNEGEPYEEYARRLTSFGYVPLHQEIYFTYYKKTFGSQQI